jgi:heterodisulfide reductase subunit C
VSTRSLEGNNGRTTLADYVRRTAGINVTTCYQCGKCSAGCPMGREMPTPPHDIMRAAINDRRDLVFSDESIWLCLTCETCSARCPKDCDPARVIDALRELAVSEGVSPSPRNVRAFHKAFLDQIKLTGRLYEVGFVVEYKMRSGDLLSDITNAPAMLKRGKLPVVPSRIAGQKDVAGIMDRCAKAASEGGQP